MISYPPFSGGGGYVNRLCSGGGKGMVIGCRDGAHVNSLCSVVDTILI